MGFGVVDYVNEIIGDDRLIELYAYWLGKQARRRMPSRGDIDPSEISPLLPHIMLIDVLSDERFRIRMVGTALDDATGVNATGRLLNEVMPDGPYAEYVQGLYQEVVREKSPIYAECEHSDPDLVPHATIRLIMPLSDDGENVNGALVGQIFEADDLEATIRPADEAGSFEEGVRVRLV